MAPKSAPFQIVVHHSGSKSAEEIQGLYADFYIAQVKNAILTANFNEQEAKTVISRLLERFAQDAPEA